MIAAIPRREKGFGNLESHRRALTAMSILVSPDAEDVRMVSRAHVPAELSGRWVIAHTRPRHEKAVAADLYVQGFDYFLPLKKSVRRCGRKKYTVIVPYLPTLIFCVSEDYDRLTWNLRRHWGVVENLHEVPSGSQGLLSSELTDFYSAVFGEMQTETTDRVIGKNARVKAGHPWAGREGIVQASAHKGWVKFPITTLGREILVEIRVEELEIC